MPNTPYLDASVQWKIRTGHAALQEPGYPEIAEAILDSGLATAVGRCIGSGKEADVYLCRDGSRWIAVKAYRFYRTSHRGGSAMKLDAMGHRAAREFELMNYAWQDGAPVPKPYERIEHVFSMEYLGTPAEAAPILQHAFLADPERFLRETLRGIERLAEAGVVHSDLSPFNILVHRDQPWIIDLAACYRVDRLGESPWVRLTEAQTAIEHGLEAIARYFRRYAIFFDSVEVLNRITRGLDRFGVLG